MLAGSGTVDAGRKVALKSASAPFRVVKITGRHSRGVPDV
jgi:hypothetical protein